MVMNSAARKSFPKSAWLHYARFSPAGSDDPQLIYTYPIAEGAAAALQPLLKHRIDLSAFDYFLEATAVASLPKEER
jgi:hypothetical protein